MAKPKHHIYKGMLGTICVHVMYPDGSYSFAELPHCTDADSITCKYSEALQCFEILAHLSEVNAWATVLYL